MNNYYVTFKYSDTVYCTNICVAKSKEDVLKHYDKYEWCNVRPASTYDMEEAKRKGMPINTL